MIGDPDSKKIPKESVDALKLSILKRGKSGNKKVKKVLKIKKLNSWRSSVKMLLGATSEFYKPNGRIDPAISKAKHCFETRRKHPAWLALSTIFKLILGKYLKNIAFKRMFSICEFANIGNLARRLTCKVVLIECITTVIAIGIRSSDSEHDAAYCMSHTIIKLFWWTKMVYRRSPDD